MYVRSHDYVFLKVSRANYHKVVEWNPLFHKGKISWLIEDDASNKTYSSGFRLRFDSLLDELHLAIL